MIRLTLGFWAGVVILAAGGPVQAQFTPPAAPAAPAVPGAAVPAAPTPAPSMTLWKFLGITPENCAKCRAKCCASPIGQMLNSMLKPVTFASGGLIPPLCPPGPSPADLAKLTDPNNPLAGGSEAVAAKIKAEEAGAKARRAAVRYLGTVDCARFPDAEGALIQSLREDTNECVRWEAALALAKGCCCTKKTVAALTLAASGKDTDKNPPETSERVKVAALNALNHCMATMVLEPEEPPGPPERPPAKDLPVPPEQPGVGQLQSAFPGGVHLAAYYTAYIPRVPRQKLMQDAARLLAEKAGNTPETVRTPGGQRGLLQLWNTPGPTTAAGEEIAFEEAALSGPFGTVPTAGPKTTVVRAGIGFHPVATGKAGDIKQVSLVQGHKPGPGGTGARNTPQARMPRPTPAPVPWPGSVPAQPSGATPPAPVVLPVTPQPQPLPPAPAVPVPLPVPNLPVEEGITVWPAPNF